MSVGYEHYLIPEDPLRGFTDSQIESIIGVLESYGIWLQDSGTVFLREDGRESQERSSDGWVWHDQVSSDAVGKLFGESKYGGGPKDMYLGGVTIVFGNAKKFFFSGNEEIEVWVTNMDLIEVDLPFSQPFHEMTYAEISEKDVNIEVHNPNIKELSWFKGWSRSAIILDFHNSVPAWSGSAQMPNNDLIVDLKSATGIQFQEIGGHT